MCLRINYQRGVVARCVLKFVITALALCGFALQVQAETSSGNVLKGQVEIFDHENNRLKDHSNVVVFLEGSGLEEVDIPQQEIPKISHKGIQFTPQVLPISRNWSIDFYNDDNIFHNAFSLSRAKPFDLGIYPMGSSKIVSFDQAGLVKLYCNIHPNMVSNILVLSNPFFALTNKDGVFEVRGIPDGEFTIRVWNEFSAEVNRTVKFSGDSSHVENFSVHKTKAFVQHKNKFGMPYREKY